MHLKTTYCFFLVVISLEYFIVDVDGFRHTEVNLAHSRKQSFAGTKVKRWSLTGIWGEFIKTVKLHFAKKEHCPFFYKNTCPILQNRLQSYIFLNGKYYATEYDISKQIPVYSAYTIDPNIRRTPGRESTWYKHPGIKDERQPTKDTLPLGLHRGHLYSQYYAGDSDGKKASNFLTNMAPQYGKFNINTWKRLEKSLHNAAMHKCHPYIGAKSYFVTGVIPSNRNLNNGINIPDYFWTAACCDTSNTFSQDNKNKGWSLAYMVENKNLDRLNVNMYFIQDFLNELEIKFLQLFARHGKVKECLFDEATTIDVIEQIKDENGKKDHFIMKGERLNSLIREQDRKRALNPYI